jgi:hypothetical protein
MDEWAISISERSSGGSKAGEELYDFKPGDGSSILRFDEDVSVEEVKPAVKRAKSNPVLPESRRRYPGPGHYDHNKQSFGGSWLNKPQSGRFSIGWVPARTHLTAEKPATWNPLPYSQRESAPGPGTYALPDRTTRYGDASGRHFSAYGKVAEPGPRSETTSRAAPGTYEVLTTCGGTHPYMKKDPLWSIGKGSERKPFVNRQENPGPGECYVTMQVKDPVFAKPKITIGTRPKLPLPAYVNSWCPETQGGFYAASPADRDMRHLPSRTSKPPMLHPPDANTVMIKSRMKYDPDKYKNEGKPGPGQHNPQPGQSRGVQGNLGGRFLGAPRSSDGPY